MNNRLVRSVGNYWLWSALGTAALLGSCATAEDDVLGDGVDRTRTSAGTAGSSTVVGDSDDPVLSPDAGVQEGPKLPPPPEVEWIERDGVQLVVDERVTAAEPESKFDATPRDGQSQLVYPLSNSMHAPNERNLTVQWKAGSSAETLFAIEFKASENTYRFVVPCTQDHGLQEGERSPLEAGECAYKVPEDQLLNVGLLNPDQPIELRVLGTDDAGVGGVTASPATVVHIAPEVIRGAFYYWSTKQAGIFRAPFGAHEAAPYITANSDTNNFACGGCHAVSRDGNMVAYITGSGFPGGLQVAPSNDPANPIIESVPNPDELYHDGVADVGGQPKPSDPFHAQGVTLNPSGDWAIIFNGNRLSVIDVQASNVTQTLKVGDPAFKLPEHVGMHPEFSPDGSKVAVALTPKLYSHSDAWDGDIGVMPFDPETGKLGDVEVVIEGGDAHPGFPSWSPDGRWLAFHQGPPGDRETARSNMSLYIAPSSGGPFTCPSADCFPLSNAQQGLQNRAGYIRFSPFDMDGGRLLFFTFNTQIDYGLILKNSMHGPGAHHRAPQMWMAAVDIEKLGSGQDASYAPVWVPLQSTKQKNHFGYWTEKLLCTSNAECGVCETCIEEACVPEPSCIK